MNFLKNIVDIVDFPKINSFESLESLDIVLGNFKK